MNKRTIVMKNERTSKRFDSTLELTPVITFDQSEKSSRPSRSMTSFCCCYKCLKSLQYDRDVYALVRSPWQQESRSSASRISVQSKIVIYVMDLVVSLLCRLIRMVSYRWIVFLLSCIDGFPLKYTYELCDSSKMQRVSCSTQIISRSAHVSMKSLL